MASILLVGTQRQNRLILYKSHQFNNLEQFGSSEKLLDKVDAVYINMPLSKRGTYIEKALQAKNMY